ncbi:MAG: DUF362 domain-containing protein [Treponema sp.]|nr:DUF362 domain-containing protein [Treponema sp.]
MKKIIIALAALCIFFSQEFFAQGKKSAVYFSREISPQSVQAIYERLGKKLSGRVAIQQSMGEPGGYLFIQPELSAPLAKKLGASYINSTGVSDTAAIRKEIAKEHGFTKAAPVDVIDEDGDIDLPVQGGRVLKKNIVGAHLKNYDSLLVLTHFKGHAVSGIGGIMKNMSIGISSPAGKRLIHSGGATSSYYTHRDQDAFLAANVEAAKSVMEFFEGRVLYINFLFKLSNQSDYGSVRPKPVIPDIGILASTDPVALDQASADLIYAAKGSEPLTKLFESRNGRYSIEYANELGLGSLNYELVEINSGEKKMKIQITIDNGKNKNAITASLAENSSAKAFYQALQKKPLVVKMNDYGSFEKVGPLGQTFPTNDEQIITAPGDIILYQGNQISIYYDKNSWSFTRLGKVDSLKQKQLKEILGSGGVTATFTIAE